FWRRVNTYGAMSSLAAGLVSSLLLMAVGPTVMDPGAGWIRAEAICPLTHPGIVSSPMGFAGGILGTLLSGKIGSSGQFETMQAFAHVAPNEIRTREPG
ncbi:cation acetate symporter, partial [Clostridium perfringens]